MAIKQQQSAGFALILTLIISSVALSIGLSLLNITVKQLTLGTTARESEIAFQTAAAGMNCLQYARNTFLQVSQAGGEFQVNCAGQTINMQDTNSSNPVEQVYDSETDFSINGRNRCIQFQMYILDATGGAESVTINNDLKPCAAGDVCTFAYSQGHNRACSELSGTGGSYVVQRELTAEF